MSQETDSAVASLLGAIGEAAAKNVGFHPYAASPGHGSAMMRRRRSVRALRSTLPVSPEVIAHVAEIMVAERSAPVLQLFVCAVNVTGWGKGWYEMRSDGSVEALSADGRYVTPSWCGDSGPSVQLVLAADLRVLDAATYCALLVRAGRIAMGGWMVALSAGLEGVVLAENSIRWWESCTTRQVVHARPLVSLSLSPALTTAGEHP